MFARDLQHKSPLGKCSRQESNCGQSGRFEDGREFLSAAELDENQNVGMGTIPYDKITLRVVERSSEKWSVTFMREVELTCEMGEKCRALMLVVVKHFRCSLR